MLSRLLTMILEAIRITVDLIKFKKSLNSYTNCLKVDPPHRHGHKEGRPTEEGSRGLEPEGFIAQDRARTSPMAPRHV